MDGQDFLASLFIRRLDVDFTVQPTGPSECRIKMIGQIRRCEQYDIPAAMNPIEQGQQLRYQTPFYLVRQRVALRRERINLVKNRMVYG